MDEEILRRIGDYQSENRYPSHSAATLELIRRGMEQIAKEQEEKKQSKSKPSCG